MQLKDIKAYVRTLLQDPDYDGEAIRTAANWFVYELFNNNRTRLMETSDVLEASAGDTEIDLPEDMLAWTSIYNTLPSTVDMEQNYVEYGAFMGSHAGFATSTVGRAGTWTDFGNAMRFANPLNVDHTFQIDYVREPEQMEADSDVCEVPARYAELVARGAKARILEIEEDYQFGQQERDLLDPLVTAFIKNESRGGGKTKPHVIRTKRGRNNGGTPRLGV